GTRAVDRLADDYPILIAPGQPGLRVNQTADEALRYSPKQLDAINLVSGAFETIEVRQLLARHGDELPQARRLVSIVDHDRLRRPAGWIDFAHDDLVVTFEGLLSETSFVPRMKAVLDLLRERLGTPVDVEFACDGEEIYLLQCRPQGSTSAEAPAAIPSDLPPERVLFTARRHVSNGRVGEITHIVYVDADAYGSLELARLRDVGRAIGRLNRLLPKRQFVLMGPGRWGSRGDIRLGVPVTYADISNTAVLVEIARSRGGYVPDLSFGTHFFQDLVESSIRYLPLYPEDPEVIFTESFFRRAPNELAALLPEFEYLAEVVRVIDVRRAADGMVLRVLMNGEQDRAVGLLARPEARAAEK
ncbi:MAG TPA: PEP/pyruvate-binding domain-containing protein, partial [Thermoanaerobaculia bacterium]|nr:PEP/pyruvate-binding domain-containing protein [Thermoanaerobaculia bacterium]